MVGVFAGHGRDVTDVDCSGDSERLISSSFDKQVLLWDVENTTIIRRFRGHAGQVNCVKMHEECTLGWFWLSLYRKNLLIFCQNQISRFRGSWWHGANLGFEE